MKGWVGDFTYRSRRAETGAPGFFRLVGGHSSSPPWLGVLASREGAARAREAAGGERYVRRGEMVASSSSSSSSAAAPAGARAGAGPAAAAESRAARASDAAEGEVKSRGDAMAGGAAAAAVAGATGARARAAAIPSNSGTGTSTSKLKSTGGGPWNPVGSWWAAPRGEAVSTLPPTRSAKLGSRGAGSTGVRGCSAGKRDLPAVAPYHTGVLGAGRGGRVGRAAPVLGA